MPKAGEGILATPVIPNSRETQDDGVNLPLPPPGHGRATPAKPQHFADSDGDEEQRPQRRHPPPAASDASLEDHLVLPGRDVDTCKHAVDLNGPRHRTVPTTDRQLASDRSSAAVAGPVAATSSQTLSSDCGP